MVKKYWLLLLAIVGGFVNLKAQTTVVDSIVVDGIYRSYRLYIPAAINAATRPLILNMHGLGSNAIEQQYYGNFMPIADTAGFYVVMPQGTSVSGTTYWNVGFPGSGNVDDVKFLSVLIDTLARRYPIDNSRVYATGMSNGGYMAHLLGIRLNNKIAAIASVAGSIVSTIYSGANPGRAVPAMQIHGTADATVPYKGFAYGVPIDSVVAFWVRNNGCNPIPTQTAVPNTNTSDGCTADHFVWSGGKGGSTVELFKVAGGEHSWPGAPPVIGITNQDFSASAEFWRFFRQYRLSTPSAVGSSPSPVFFHFAPNPARNMLQIDTKEPGVVSVYDQAGKLLLTTREKVLDVSALPGGNFVLEFNNGREKSSAVFVKE
jgi:polyhydroxybutyrate depolymerase